MRGIYVHVPFCLRKCAYCDFYSVVAGDGARDRFCELVLRELELLARAYPEEARRPADTVYFGGGTPTVLGPDRLCRTLAAIRSLVPVAEGAEITAEANPGTVGEQDLARLRDAGFTRLSIGAQSFHAPTLSALGRIHSGDDIRAAWEEARRCGFPSLSLDLIFGNPGQDEALWNGDLRRAAALLPEHVSAYALTPERGTPLHAEVARGDVALPPDDTVARMYDAAREAFGAAGYRHYEISNFCQPGKECRHNRKYWERAGYVGLGPSAHGLLFPGERAPLGMRSANPRSLGEYAARLDAGRLPWVDTAVSGVEDAWKEFLIFGLRLEEGVSWAEGETRFGPPPEPLREAVEPLVASGLLVRAADRLRLPQRYWFVSNEVLGRLA